MPSGRTVQQKRQASIREALRWEGWKNSCGRWAAWYWEGGPRLPYLGKASLVRLPLRRPLAPFCSLLFSILIHIRLPSSSSTSPPPFLSLSFFHNLANTDTLIPLGSITLLRLHLVDIHVHDSISTFAPSTDPSFSNLHSADSTNIPFFFLPDTAKHLPHTYINV
jgi:hypothetical protein